MKTLVSAKVSREIDREAQDEWGFNPFSLIEAAGQGLARVFENAFSQFFEGRTPDITVFAGKGNNAGDALCMLRYWLIRGAVSPAASRVILDKPFFKPGERVSPLDFFCVSLRKMGVPLIPWEGIDPELTTKIAGSDIILDGIAGTGCCPPLTGNLNGMAGVINAISAGRARDRGPLVVSVDLPSGLSEGWERGMPLVRADITLVIEPGKYCLYNPGSRPYAGHILPVGNIFPPELVSSREEAKLLDWETCWNMIPPISAASHKYIRGTVEIHAGSPGFTGAALIAGRGSQAAGAGLVRLVVDDEIYPVIAGRASGVMVSRTSSFSAWSGQKLPGALLLGPGWGRGPAQKSLLEAALDLEKAGTPLILDADALHLAKDLRFHGNALLTPHIGEFSAMTGLAIPEIEDRPIPALLKAAEERNAVILLKSHVMIVASPRGIWGVLDGMAPNLANGGSGDLLAGFCAALASRTAVNGACDLYAAAAVAASLFMAAGKSPELRRRFSDPLEIADKAAELAGRAWLAGGIYEGA